ncbi:MAG: MAPEG family protein [Hyphomonadaceae bacterium]
MTTPAPRFERPTLFEYGLVGTVLAIGVAVIVWVTGWSAIGASNDIVLPLFAMFALTAFVWLLMVITRNAAVLFGAASVRYFRDYNTDLPRDWVERPTRAFNNLMQAPVLFYIAGLLAAQLQLVDAPLVGLAWAFVIARVVHAVIFMVLNYVPLRFAFYAVSCIFLGVMWARIAIEYMT